MPARLAALLILCASHAWADDLLSDLIFYDVEFGAPIAMGPITAAAVEGVELLYATPGSGDISEIAGHLLLRIKLNNNPAAAARGEENPNDLVISFLADTESGRPSQPLPDVVVAPDCDKPNWFNLVDNHRDEAAWASIWQSLRGLSGGFPIVMDRQTLGHALKSYTIEQDRSLLRYRLNLTPQQTSNLISRLDAVRSEPPPPYFFFSQNCGSVLIRVVAEGIGDDTAATFSPLVAPPHTLIGNWIRRGVATRLTPAFYSYRHRGFISQELLRDQYTTMSADYTQLPWPRLTDLTHHRDAHRAAAVVDLAPLALTQPELTAPVYVLASLIQESEMVYAHKDLICENYTSDTTAAARRLQRDILASGGLDEVTPLNSSSRHSGGFSATETRSAKTGTAHTELYRLAVGVSATREGGNGQTALMIDGALLNQDMGSRSQVAMQRSSAVRLGGWRAQWDGSTITDWQAQALTLRKFRDTLYTVPSAFSSTRGLGIGLAVAEVEHWHTADATLFTLGRAEGLACIFATPNNNDFLLVSAGAELWRRDNYTLSFPIGVEHLWSLDDAMNWQWRTRATVDAANTRRVGAASGLMIRLGDDCQADWLLAIGIDYRQDEFHDRPQDRLCSHVLLEVNRW